MNTNNPLSLVQQLYPDFEKYHGESNYNPLIQSFGEVLLQVDDNDYQGDTRVILKKDNDYGLLIFGWGSCSGCDALQACNSYKEIEELRKYLEGSIRWGSADELLTYFQTHDWEGDYSWHDRETRQFVADGIKLLSTITTA